MVEISVDEKKCTGCGDCADVCPAAVYEIKKGKSKVVNADECVECCACIDVCPVNCIVHSSCQVKA